MQRETLEILQARRVVQPWDVQALQHAALSPQWRQKLQIPLMPHWSGWRCMTYTLHLSFYERNDVVGARMLYYIAVLYCFAVFVTFPWISKHAMHITILSARLAGFQNLIMCESNSSSSKGVLYVKTWGRAIRPHLHLWDWKGLEDINCIMKFKSHIIFKRNLRHTSPLSSHKSAFM
jgi:hypothetical protein